MKRIFTGVVLVSVLFLTASATVTSAHVSVKPAEVGVGAFQNFTVSVPVEKDNPTVGVRLWIPEGLHNVTPNVKPGWKIEIKKDGIGEDAVVTEIKWTGGIIPSGQRDEFVFSAQAPSSETTLKWMAYQTYQDGSIVEWIHEPSANHEDDSSHPYSQTKVVNDLSQKTMAAPAMESNKDQLNQWMPYIAFVLSVVAISLSLGNRRK